MNALQLNVDLSQRCVVDSNALAWNDSPSPLVQRRLLERDGGELARATSVVRYAAGARFDLHTHDLGEEILVLEGTLSDARLGARAVFGKRLHVVCEAALPGSSGPDPDSGADTPGVVASGSGCRTQRFALMGIRHPAYGHGALVARHLLQSP